MGAWIEICIICYLFPQQKWSLPLWERGLKSSNFPSKYRPSLVAPLVGAWIEIIFQLQPSILDLVAPLVGAWIEIYKRGTMAKFYHVAPLVGAWIEILLLPRPRYVIHVAPLVGAWIEIKINS